MSSGFHGGDADFYGVARIGGGSGMINEFQNQYMSQLGGLLVNPSSSMVAKRSLAELERQQQQQQQQQQSGVEMYLRSVKQRTHNHTHTSPISPLSPVDFSSTISSEVSSVAASPTLPGRYGIPLCNPNLSGLMYSNPVPNGVESENKMRNRLQELEKQLLDDNDDEEGDAASVITSSEWSETMQNLITPSQTPLSPSPTSSSSSSSSVSLSSYSNSSKQSLLDAAAAISEGKTDVAMATLLRLKQFSNARGDPEQRLTAYMVSALRSRVNPTEIPPPIAELRSNEHMIAAQMLYEASPCFKLGFMAANLSILEATRDRPNNVHVVDFDIGHGIQYITLIRAFAAQQSSKPHIIKITTVINPGNGNENGLRIVGDRLRKLAESFGVSLKFNVVRHRISDLNRGVLECDADEALAVNFPFQLYKMPDESVSTENPRDELLRLVKGLAPRVVTLVEQEMNANTAPFVARVAESCAYYRALFDSLDVTMTRNNADRVRVEECLARKASNSVACEGRNRVERCEVFGKWRARMRMAGFEPRPMSQHVAESLRVQLGSAIPNNPGFTIKEEAGGICFGWMGRVLTVTSTWR